MHEISWPTAHVLDGTRLSQLTLPVPSPNAIAIFVGDETPREAVEQAFQRTLRKLEQQQRSHGGRPHRSTQVRPHFRLARAAFLLWLARTRRFGTPLGPEKIHRLWRALTEDWSSNSAAAFSDVVPASLHQLPQAWYAWVEWQRVGAGEKEQVEEITKDAVRVILRDLPVYAPISEYESELQRILSPKPVRIRAARKRGVLTAS